LVVFSLSNILPLSVKPQVISVAFNTDN
jgi:hypothetical protein